MPVGSVLNLASLKRKELIQLCKEHGIKGVGKNSELIERLLQAAPKAFTHSEQGHEGEGEEEHRMQDAHKSASSHSDAFHASALPRTPIKAAVSVADAIGPILDASNRTPAANVAKSIVSSVKKTGLQASPVRVPFALSPLAVTKTPAATLLMSEGIRKTPMVVAKEPSVPIKEAFMGSNSESDSEPEQMQRLPNETSLKRKLEQFQEASFADFNSQPPPKDCSLHDSEEGSNSRTETENMDMAEERDSAEEPPSKQPRIEETQDEVEETNEPKEINKADRPNRPSSNIDEDTLEHRANPSLDPSSNPGANGHLPQPPALKRSADDLLPSGIKKLLEKKRLERLQQSHGVQDQKAHSHGTQTQKAHTHDPQSQLQAQPQNQPPRPKFNLDQSLKRPLPYKPHAGPLHKRPDHHEPSK